MGQQSGGRGGQQQQQRSGQLKGPHGHRQGGADGGGNRRRGRWLHQLQEQEPKPHLQFWLLLVTHLPQQQQQRPFSAPLVGRREGAAPLRTPKFGQLRRTAELPTAVETAHKTPHRRRVTTGAAAFPKGW